MILAPSDISVDFQDVTLLCHPPATSCTVLFHYADNSQNELGFDIFVFSVSDPQPVPAQSYRPATLGYGCCPGSDPTWSGKAEAQSRVHLPAEIFGLSESEIQKVFC